MRLTRHGATLVELLVATALSGLVLSAALLSLRELQRHTQAVAERAVVSAALRTGAQFAAHELRDLATVQGGDLVVLAPDRMVYRVARGFGVACGLGPDGLLVEAAGFRALRLPAADRDSLDVLLPAADSGRPAWWRSGIAGPARAALCPDGVGALALPLSRTDSLPADPGGLPVRTWEVMEVRAYASGGASWLGVRSVSAGEVIQPLLGPLAPEGLVLRYQDSAGAPVTLADQVARIEIVLRLRGDPGVAAGGAARAAGAVRDSLLFGLTLRNARP